MQAYMQEPLLWRSGLEGLPRMRKAGFSNLSRDRYKL